jgi:predicted dehydrogenase
MSAVSEKPCAIVGFGRLGELHLEVLSELPELQITGAMDPDPARRELARAAGVQAFASIEELLASGPPHVAIVCAPPSSHLQLAEPLLRAGVDLMIEAPLAAIPEEADRIAAGAERLGRLARTGARLRAAAAIEMARVLVAEGRIGRLCWLEINLARKLDLACSWRGDPALSGGGVWMELGSDALDAAELLAGPIERLRMVEELRVQGAAVEDEVSVETEHAGGLGSRIHLSWNRQVTAPLARCVGTEGELIVGWAQLLHRSEGGDCAIGAGYDPRGAMRRQLEEFLRARVRAGETEDPGALAVHWIHAGYRSVASRRWEVA